MTDEIIEYSINFNISQMIEIFDHCNYAYMKELTVARGQIGGPVSYTRINIPEHVLSDLDGEFPTMNQYGFSGPSTYQSNQIIIHQWSDESDVWMPAHDASWHKEEYTPY